MGVVRGALALGLGLLVVGCVAPASPGHDAAVTEDAGIDAAPDAPDARAPECTPGTRRFRGVCGRCGRLMDGCDATGTWVTESCADESGSCMEGEMRAAPCGPCGSGTAGETCDQLCTWRGRFCDRPSACWPGRIQASTDGCPSGQTRNATCDATCMPAGGTCMPFECSTMGSEMVSCNECGAVRTRHCVAGFYVNDPCSGDECHPGDTETVPCGICGTQTRTCSTGCAWTMGVCTGEAPCPTPGPATCLDATTLRRPISPTCVAGACAVMEDVICPHGCVAGACASILDHGLGGTSGFGTDSVTPGDDTSARLALPSPLFFYGGPFDSAYLSTNGNITFTEATSEYTPLFPTEMGGPMIAPWWADADTTRPASSGTYVGWHVDGLVVVLTWFQVGYFFSHVDRLNSYQVVLTLRPDVGYGDFDVELRYETCAWTAGDITGVAGLGTFAAAAGFSAGDGTRALALPGSGTPAVLDLCSTSNVGMPGIWRYEVRGGIPRAAP